MKYFSILFLMITGFMILAGCTHVEQPVFGGTVTDIDGNVYHTVTLGTQTWMIDNLKTTHYNDSTAIALVQDSAVWRNEKSSAYCWYNNDSTIYKSTYGALYNWYAVNTGKLAPKGWHVPTDTEWTTLQKDVSQFYNSSGSLAKILASTNYWASCPNSLTVGNNRVKNNTSGFSAIPGGWRNNERTSFTKIDSLGGWWSSSAPSDTTALTLIMRNNISTVEQYPYKPQTGLSVRCVKN